MAITRTGREQFPATGYSFLLILLLAALPLAGCKKEDRSATGIANPASVHCIQQGGRLEIRTGPDGGQFGVCVLPDGSECEEWAYFRGECKEGEKRH